MGSILFSIFFPFPEFVMPVGREQVNASFIEVNWHNKLMSFMLMLFSFCLFQYVYMTVYKMKDFTI